MSKLMSFGFAGPNKADRLSKEQGNWPSGATKGKPVSPSYGRIAWAKGIFVAQAETHTGLHDVA